MVVKDEVYLRIPHDLHTTVTSHYSTTTTFAVAILFGLLVWL